MYASDLERAYDTATIIASKNKSSSSLATDQNHNIVEANELLRERCFGIFELRPHKEFVAAAEEGGFDKTRNLYEFVPEGGEGLPDVKKRATKFLDHVFESVTKNDIYQNKTCNILVASHSGYLRQMSVHLLKDCRTKVPVTFECPPGEDLDKILERAWKNTAFSVFEIQIDTETNELISIQCDKYACSNHLDFEIKNKCNY
jgi:broad specificity phosphatase PhoE